ncbi:hypothetical protein RDI58_000939 [Solanum bulbocastanum]|uniref:Uncharacterized protein n=1 Tax=Solanum bulbocastanum TaxID=147425 RepID=A0AAN8UBL7_SOLBU
MVTIDANEQGNIKRDQHIAPKQTQATRLTNAKESTETSNEKRHNKGEKATWKVKDKVNIKGNTMPQSKGDEEKQPNNNSKEWADDIIIFTSGWKHSLKLIMNTLSTYEEVLGHLINKAKIHFLLHSNAFKTTYDRVKKYTGFHQREAPITYLGCPSFIGRPKIIHCSDLINKVVNRITGWQSKILSYGGKQPPFLRLLLRKCNKLWLISFGDGGMTRKNIIGLHGKI